MTPEKLKGIILDDVPDFIDGALGFTVGCVVLIVGMLLGFFPEVHEDMRNRTLARFSFHPIRWCYKCGDSLCARTRCANCLWLFYVFLLTIHIILSRLFSTRGVSWLLISG